MLPLILHHFLCPVLASVIHDIPINAFHGLASPTVAFPRDENIYRLLQEIACSRATIIHAPPASGKTSLLQMLETKLTGRCVVKYVRFQVGLNPYDLLANQGGINILTGFIDDQLKTSRASCIMLDDAQNAVDDETNYAFWGSLLKDITLPQTIRFVITSTYLIGGTVSPVEFSAYPNITPAQMLLNPVQSRSYLVDFLNFEFKEFTSLIDLIVEECGGNIGAMTIVDHFFKTEFYGRRRSNLQEQELLDVYISPAILLRMKRLFESETIKFDIHNKPVMIDLLQGEFVYIPHIDFARDTELKHYVRCGILTREEPFGLTKFSNAISRRYFMFQTYPPK